MFMTELRCKIGLRSAEKVPKLVNRKQVMFMTELRCKIGLRSAEKVPKLVNRKQVGNKNGDMY